MWESLAPVTNVESGDSHMVSATFADVVIRQAERSDVDAIADAHRDSIRSLGIEFYARTDVDAWQDGLTGDLYVKAMDAGEVFFVATGTLDGSTLILGFSSDYLIEGTTHGTSVYVRGAAARRGIGTALLRRAEAHAAGCGARSIHIEASLAGYEFYRANGFTETRRGESRLKSGHPIACVFMHKELAVG
jgi:ribosomal protein S18 acetylase RimI-like enzyme